MDTCKLTELCRIQYGYAFDSASFTEDASFPPLVRIRDVKRGFSETYYSGKYSEEYIVRRGDILIGMDGEFNIARWQSEPALLNQRVCKIIPNQQVDGSYLLFALTKILKKIEDKTAFVTVKHLSAKELNKIELRIPNYEQQMQISSTLEKALSIISRRQYQLAKLDELVKCRFVEMFGEPMTNTKQYEIASLNSIASYWNGLTYSPEDVAEDGTIVLRSSNIQNSVLHFKDTVRVNCRITEKKYVQENDILMCSRNGSAKLVGKVALIQGIKEPMAFGAFMMIIRSSLYHPYLLTYFQTPAFRLQIATGATTTINQITGSMLDKVKLPIPPVSEVEEFATFVRRIDKLRFEIQASLDKTQQLFDSLMQEYFG